MRIYNLWRLRKAVLTNHFVRLEGFDPSDVATRRDLDNLLKANSIQTAKVVPKLSPPFVINRDSIRVVGTENELSLQFSLHTTTNVELVVYIGVSSSAFQTFLASSDA